MAVWANFVIFINEWDQRSFILDICGIRISERFHFVFSQEVKFLHISWISCLNHIVIVIYVTRQDSRWQKD